MESLRSDFEDLIEAGLVDGDFIRNVAHVWIDKYNLNDYIDCIRFHKIDSNTYGFYDEFNKDIIFDFDNVVNNLKKRIVPFRRRIFDNYTEEELLEVYYRLFSFIMHECGHGYQQKLIEEDNSFASKVLGHSLDMAFKYDEIYLSEHDNFPHEHYSDLLGVLFAQDIMNELLNKDFINDTEQLRKLKFYLLRNYYKINVEYMAPCDKVVALTNDDVMKDKYRSIGSFDNCINPIMRTSLGVSIPIDDINMIKSINEKSLSRIKKDILFK